MKKSFLHRGLLLLSLAVMIGFAGCTPSTKTTLAEEEVFRGYEEFNIHRGINMSHWLSQSKRRGVEREQYFTSEDMEIIATLGFDHVRIPIDEEQMWDEQGNKESEAFTLLHNAIGWAFEKNLKVIVDVHIIRSHYFNAASNALWTDRNEQLKFINLWTQLSEELKKYPNDKLAYELMNEPVADDPDVWNKLVEETIAEIRKNEPARKLVVGSNRWQSYNTFKDLRIPENDRNIILSFHFYEPFLLTHHQASWTDIGRYKGSVKYPGLLIEPENISDTLPADLQERLKNSNHVHTKETLAEMIRIPLEYAKKYNLPLYCGEWGCMPTVPEESRLQWYEDVRSILEENEIAWTKWDYKGSFGIVDAGTLQPKQSLVEKLVPSEKKVE